MESQGSQRLSPLKFVVAAVILLLPLASAFVDLDAITGREHWVGLAMDRAESCDEVACSVVTEIEVVLGEERIRFQSDLDAERFAPVRVVFDRDDPAGTMQVDRGISAIRWIVAVAGIAALLVWAYLWDRKDKTRAAMDQDGIGPTPDSLTLAESPSPLLLTNEA